MIVDCPSCGATYNISDEKVRGRRVRVRCKNCSGPIIVDGEHIDAEDATRVYQPSFEPNTYEDTDESTRVMSPGGSPSPEPETAPAPGAWTVNVSESDQRTMTLEEIVDTYNAGFLTEEAFVWRDGMGDWMPLMEVEDIRSAIESGQATKVVKPAALRAPARRAAANPPTPVTYSAPSAPPRARLAAVPSSSVEYAPAAPTLPKAQAPARVRSAPRNAGQDLFGGIASAGSEQELLRSSSMPLETYKDKPTGARNESSILFSLNTVKAGVGSPASASPRGLTAAPPTAADILGMDMSGGLPGVDMNAALMSAPAVEPPPPRPAQLPPVRERMDTLPPVARRGTRPMAIALVVVAAGVMLVALVFVLRARVAPARTGTAVTGERAPTATNATTTTTAAPSSAPVAATPVSAEPAATAAPPAAPTPPPETPTHVAAPVPAPEAPGIRAASTGRPSFLPAPKPEKGTKPEATAAKGDQKVVLEEEQSEPKAAPPPASEPKAEAPSEAPPAAADKPSFDMSAAKAALEAAASSAPSCRTPDGPTGKGKVQVTFSPSGRATSANVIEGAFGGTPVGGCVAKLFRSARVPAFTGDPVTVAKSFTIPE